MGGKKNAYVFVVGVLRIEGENLEDVGADRRITLRVWEWQDGTTWTGLMWLRLGRSSGLLWNCGVSSNARNVWCPVWCVCSVFGSVAKQYISPSHNSVLLPVCLPSGCFFLLRSCFLICKSFQLMGGIRELQPPVCYSICSYTVPCTVAEYNTYLFLHAIPGFIIISLYFQ